jgi:hypothetical protein
MMRGGLGLPRTEHGRFACSVPLDVAPRTKNRTLAAVLTLLGQTKRPCPKRLSWRASLQKYFGVDPLIDSQDQPMRWVGRLKPIIPR